MMMARDRDKEILSRLLGNKDLYEVFLWCCKDDFSFNCSLDCENYNACLKPFLKFDRDAGFRTPYKDALDAGIAGYVLTIDEAKQLVGELKKINPDFEVSVARVKMEFGEVRVQEIIEV